MIRNQDHPLKAKIYSKYPSMNAFCESAEIDKTTMYKILRYATRMPNGYTIHKISTALQLPYEYVVKLIGRSEYDI